MNRDVYPVLSPNVSMSVLNEKLTILTQLENFKTKTINNFQTEIVKLCNGKNEVHLIQNKLQEIDKNIYTLLEVEKFITALTNLEYLQLSPVEIEVDVPSFFNANCKKSKDEFVPTQLHTITVSITESCCMKCSHCSQSAPYGLGNEISFSKLKTILDDAYTLGARYFGIFGGEPLLHNDIIEIVRYAHNIGFRDILIFSKGTLIDKEKARELKAAGVQSIKISCDSHIPEKYDEIVGIKGSFGKFFTGIYELMSVGIVIKLKIVVTNNNKTEIMDMVKFFVKNGVYDIDIEVVVPVGRADFALIPDPIHIYNLKNNLERFKSENTSKYKRITFKYLEYGKAKSCSGGIGSVMIFADGTVAPCDKSYPFREQIGFGNVYENSLLDIWENGNFGQFRNLSDNETCKTCGSKITCRGGCILNGLISTGKILSADIACEKVGGIKKGILFNEK